MSRSFTHPLTNTVVFNKIDLSKKLTKLFCCKLSGEDIPTFLHEATHHWCFSSPVGLALSIVGINSRAKLFMDKESVKENYLQTLTDELKYNTCITFLKPILEGIALFAEFDLKIGDSKVISNPSFISAILSSQMKDPRSDQFFNEFSFNLQKGRFSEFNINRKADILYHPYDCEKSPYLMGYLFIKHCYLLMRSKFQSFNDPDLFMNYFRTFFFEDWGLAHLILKWDTNSEFTVQTILDYLARKIIDLKSIDHSEKLKSFEFKLHQREFDVVQISTEQVAGSLSTVPIYDFDKPSVEKLMNERIDSILSFVGQDSPLNYLFRSLISNRNLINIGQAEFKAEMNDAGHLVILSKDDKPIIMFNPKHDIGKSWKDKITIDLIFRTEPLGMYAVISRNKIAITYCSTSSNDFDIDSMSNFIGRNEIGSFLERINEAANFFYEDLNYENFNTKIQERIHSQMRKSFQIEFKSMNDGLLKKSFLANGLGPLFDSEAELKEFIKMSYVASSYQVCHLDFFKSLWPNENFQDVIDRINQKTKKFFGFDNFRFDEKNICVYSTLI